MLSILLTRQGYVLAVEWVLKVVEHEHLLVPRRLVDSRVRKHVNRTNLLEFMFLIKLLNRT